jgi:penicillin-binding protein 1C
MATRRLERPHHATLSQRARRSLPAWLTYVLGTLLALVVLGVLGVVAAVGIAFATGTVDSVFGQLPRVETVVEDEPFRTASILDRNGQLLYEVFDPQGGKRTMVPLTEMPRNLVSATIATEDPRFYDNPGFDLIAIARAVLQNFLGQSIVSGGSTITQQLVKNSLLSEQERYEQSYIRKAKEVILAYELTQRYSKDQILERYLNENNYGNLAYGVEAAAQTYFGKSVKDLDLAEAALIAGLPQAPYSYDPITHPEAAKSRQEDVLGLMVRHGYLTQEEADAAKEEPLHYRAPKTLLKAPHFSLLVRQVLEDRLTKEQLYYSGLQVQTTLDLRLQDLAEKTVDQQIKALKSQNVRNAALVAIDPRTGEVVAMVGNADFWDDKSSGQVNMATAPRLAGSTIKPFVYLTAFDRFHLSPATVLQDEPVAYSAGRGLPEYRPQNADGKFRGNVTARRALGNSLNVPTLRLLSQYGIAEFLPALHQIGFTTLNQGPDYYGLPIGVGSGEIRLLDLVFAYSTVANNGLQVGEPVPVAEQRVGYRTLQPAFISRIIDDSGGATFTYEPAGRQVVSEQSAWLISNILSDEAAKSELVDRMSAPAVDQQIAWLTATTDRGENAWAVAYTPDLVVGVWVGNANNQSMNGVTGANGAGPILRSFVEGALRDAKPATFTRPAGLIQVAVDARTGLRPGPGAETIVDWFDEGNVPHQWSAAPTPTPGPAKAPTATPKPTR